MITEEKEKKKILILAANPKDTKRVRFDEEVREIEESLQRSKLRDQFHINSKFAIRRGDIRRALLDYAPDIVHFTGHGNKEGLVVEDKSGISDLIYSEALSGLFKLFSNKSDKVECVILNACYSEFQAEAIGKHINYVIGMKKEIKDKAAIEFSVGFYDALGAGKPVEDAFEFGTNAILHKFPKISEHLIPVLIQKNIVDKEVPGLDIPPGIKTIGLAIRSFKHSAHDIDNQVDDMLCLCDRFDDRHLVKGKGTWEEVSKEIKDFISRNIKAQHRYNLYLPLHTSLTFLVGRALDPKCGAEINIFQPSLSSSFKLWQFTQDVNFKNDNSWIVEESSLGNSGKEMAAALSVTHPTQADVEAYVKKQHPNISHLIHLKLPEIHHRSIKDESHAYTAAYNAVVILRNKYREIGASKLNLFMAAPNVFTYMLGQQSHLLPGKITLYEYDFDSKELGAYSPSLTL